MFYDNFLKICQRSGISASRALSNIGLSSGILTWWKNGAVPKAETAKRIADYFGVSVDELLADSEHPSRLTTEKGVRVAVLSTVGAGIPMEAIVTFDQDDPDSWEEIAEMDAQKGAVYFALKIRGNSMEPEIRHGDIVIVRRSDEFDDGELVIALVNGDEGVCKKVKFTDNGIILLSFNPDYPPMAFTRQEIKEKPVRLLGVVTECRHRYEK